MSRSSRLAAVFAAAAIAGVSGTAWSTTIIVDDFDTGPLNVLIPDGALGPNSGGVACAGCVGGARHVSIMRTNASDDAIAVRVNPAGFAAGWFLYSNEVGVDSQATVLWDGGTDGTNDHGLSLDLTGAGGGVAVELESDIAVAYTFTLFSDSGARSSTATLTLTSALGDGDLINGGVLKILTAASFTGDVDFSNVQSILMTINGSPSFDTAIRFVEYRLPEPGSLGLLGLGLLGVAGFSKRRRLLTKAA